MILSIGEILGDMIGNSNNNTLNFKLFCGGAPFNVAVNAKNAGANVGFIGKVGKDVVGKFLLAEAKKANFDNLDIQIDSVRNTTLAFVTLKDGERDFAFNRHDTADFNVEFDQIDFSKYENLNIIHLGSLMLSEERGKEFARKVVAKARELKVKLSFDVNFRMDTYKDFEDAKNAYDYFIKSADIVKFSEDELTLYTGIDNQIDAIKSIYQENQLFVLTLGSKGSLYYYNGEMGQIPTKEIKPIDTTGAGDAFFGTLLAQLEDKEYTRENVESALVKANQAGAETTQFLGAVKL